jgi:hypothetical protein
VSASGAADGRASRRHGVTALAAAGLYALATVVATWPLAAHVRSHVAQMSRRAAYADSMLMSWILSWDLHALLRTPLHVYDANIAYPLHGTLAFSEALLSEALLVLPLAPLTPCPGLLLNACALATFVLGGLGAFLLVRYVSGSVAAALVGGLMFAFAPDRFGQLDRLNALAVFWTPFFLLALHRQLDAGGLGRAVALAGAFLVQTLTTAYVAYGTAVFLPIYVAGLWLVGPPRPRGRWIGALAALGAGGAIAALASAPYPFVRDEMALGRDPVQLILHAVPPIEVVRMATSIPGYLTAKVLHGIKGGGVVGVATTVMLVAGIVAGGRIARLWAVLALVALVLALGPVVVLPWSSTAWVRGPYGLLYEWVPGFSAMREPRRFMGFVAGWSALAGGLGAAAVLARCRTSAARALVVAALVGLVALEVGWAPVPLVALPAVGARASLYERIAAGAPGAVVELPIGGDVDLLTAMFRSTYHLRPLLNGAGGFNLTGAELRRRLHRFPDRRSAAWLRRLGVRFVVYDAGRPRTRPPRSMARRLRRAAPDARVVGVADRVLLVEMEPLPPIATPAPPGELSRARWRVRASAGDASAAVDGDLASHWTSPVDAQTGGGWYEVDFGEEVTLDRLRLELGSHYGEYPRAWKVDALDGGTVRPVAARRYPPAPLAAYRADRRRIVVDLLLPETRARVLRIEVPRLRLPGAPPPFDVPMEYWGWRRWGIHELRAYETARGGARATS